MIVITSVMNVESTCGASAPPGLEPITDTARATRMAITIDGAVGIPTDFTIGGAVGIHTNR